MHPTVGCAAWGPEQNFKQDREAASRPILRCLACRRRRRAGGAPRPLRLPANPVAAAAPRPSPVRPDPHSAAQRKCQKQQCPQTSGLGVPVQRKGAPSPQGYSPGKEGLCRPSPRSTRSGEEVRVSAACSSASAPANPGMARSNLASAVRKAAVMCGAYSACSGAGRTPSLRARNACSAVRRGGAGLWARAGFGRAAGRPSHTLGPALLTGSCGRAPAECKRMSRALPRLANFPAPAPSARAFLPWCSPYKRAPVGLGAGPKRGAPVGGGGQLAPRLPPLQKVGHPLHRRHKAAAPQPRRLPAGRRTRARQEGLELSLAPYHMRWWLARTGS